MVYRFSVLIQIRKTFNANRMLLDFPPPDDAGARRKIEVAPGIHWLRMPLPFALDHINLWLLGKQARQPAALDHRRYRLRTGRRRALATGDRAQSADGR